MKTILFTLQFSLSLLFWQVNEVMAVETDSLTIDPDNPLVTDMVQVQSYFTIPNCCTGIDSVCIYTNLFEYYWEQTQCSDPWNAGLGESNEETRDSLLAYFTPLGVALHHVHFIFDSELEETCTACDCKTGTVIYVYVEHDDTTQLSETGFMSGNNMLYDIVRTYHTDHDPACDCYCQCADTVDIGMLEAASHRLLFNIVIINPYSPFIHEAYDSLDFNVANIPSSQLNIPDECIYKIYPNPAHRHINVSNNLIGFRYDIIDLSGKKVIEGKVLKNYIRVDLLPGIYLVRFYKDNNLVITGKLSICIKN